MDEHRPTNLRDPERVLDALRRVTICDPACGSGAYLLGMLQELLQLRASLFANVKLDPISDYDRKLEIIQNNVYGVDIDPFAVNIARLRLWLSLAVDFDGPKPEPLPNLDYKIEVGDSLLGPAPTDAPQSSFQQHQIGEYLRLKREFLEAHGERKKTLRTEIAAARQAIAGWANHGASSTGFDWQVEFAEVFLNDGFDIVLANPPYVRADAQFKHIHEAQDRQVAIERWKKYRKALVASQIYQTLYEKWDLYVPFLERAYQTLRSSGQMVFIISDAYNTG